MTKIVEDIELTLIDGKAYKIPATDQDGDAVFETGDNGDIKVTSRGNKIPKMVSGTVSETLKLVMFNIPKELIAKNDSLEGIALWKALKGVKDGFLTFEDDTYNWIHRVLNRQIPLNEEGKKAGLEVQEYCVHLWGMSAEWVVDQFVDTDNRKYKESKLALVPNDIGESTEEGEPSDA